MQNHPISTLCLVIGLMLEYASNFKLKMVKHLSFAFITVYKKC